MGISFSEKGAGTDGRNIMGKGGTVFVSASLRRHGSAVLLREKETKVPSFKEAIEQLSEKERHAVQEYLDAEDRCEYEENQQAYVQGILDCVEILKGAGLLK